MQSMRVHVVDDRAFAAPRSVQDEGFQGFCVVSRVVNFQGFALLPRWIARSNGKECVQSVVLSACSSTTVALQSPVFSEHFV